MIPSSCYTQALSFCVLTHPTLSTRCVGGPDFVFISQKRKWSTEKLGDLPKATQGTRQR